MSETLDFTSLAIWRELCEYVVRWQAAQPPSRRRSSFGASEVPERLRHLLATPRRKRSTWRAFDEKSGRWVDGCYVTGDPMGLDAAQVRQAVDARRATMLISHGNHAGMGWVLRSDWKARLRWLEDPEGEAVLEALAGVASGHTHRIPAAR